MEWRCWVADAGGVSYWYCSRKDHERPRPRGRRGGDHAPEEGCRRPPEYDRSVRLQEYDRADHDLSLLRNFRPSCFSTKKVVVELIAPLSPARDVVTEPAVFTVHV